MIGVFILAALFLPVYRGRVINCGPYEGAGCAYDHLNLREYIEYRESKK